MHRLIQDHLEEVLSGNGVGKTAPSPLHLAECEECREEVSVMRQHASMLGPCAYCRP